MVSEGPRVAAAALLAAAIVGCAGGIPVQRAAELTGEWKGRFSGPMGNAPAAMTVAETGAYTGTMYLDAGDRSFHGSLVVVRPGEIRYQGSDGTGAVRVSEERGRRVLKFLRDGGGVDAVFRR
jgi:hypothetical protein